MLLFRHLGVLTNWINKGLEENLNNYYPRLLMLIFPCPASSSFCGYMIILKPTSAVMHLLLVLNDEPRLVLETQC